MLNINQIKRGDKFFQKKSSKAIVSSRNMSIFAHLFRDEEGGRKQIKWFFYMLPV